MKQVSCYVRSLCNVLHGAVALQTGLWYIAMHECSCVYDILCDTILPCLSARTHNYLSPPCLTYSPFDPSERAL